MANAIPFTNGFYINASLPLSHQECTNMYVQKVQAPALSQEVLLGTPGITSIHTTGILQQVNRGAHVKNKIAYFVNGASLYRLDRTWVSDDEVFSHTFLGTIAGSGRVCMEDNGTQLMILVPGGKGYIYNENAVPAFQEITDADFTANGIPQYLAFIDGYFAVTTDSKKWTVSSLNDGLAWNALDFATAESDPDVIVAPVVIKNSIFITGSETTEGYQNIGGADFPFQRNNIYLDKGCFAPFSLINTNGTFFMIGGGVDESAAVWQYIGGEFEKRSTDAIDSILSTYTDAQLATAFAFAYSQASAFFVGFTIIDRTFVYDMASKVWHERKSQLNDVAQRWRVNSLVTAYGRVLVFDAVDGRIGALSLSEYQEYGTNIIRLWSLMPFALGGVSVFLPYIEVTAESGVGNDLEPDPVISMSISKDGKTWNYERSRALGRKGEFMKRQIWRKSGRCPRFAVLRFRVSDPVKVAILKIEAE